MLYAATIFASAFLLFQIQPVIAKLILPWFGGTAAVWTTCMLFFQAALVGGYLYAHGVITRLAGKQLAFLHVALLALSLAALPVIPPETWKPADGSAPIARILALLAVSVGLPYFMLSTTGPLVQAWFARANPGASPYRLFALSNAGSMLALAAYPFIVEPVLATRLQARTWSWGYALFALLCTALAWRHRSDATPAVAEPADASKPTWTRQALWMAFAACASTLLLATTNQMTQDVAPIPLLWIAPLALYLLSFILTFESEGWYRRGLYLPLTAIALAAMALAYSSVELFGATSRILLFCGSLFLCAMTCHGEVASLRPDPRYLTTFYLMISVGGAIGGLFVGVIAPHVFSLYLEMPIAIVACAALVLAVHWNDESSVMHSATGRVLGVAYVLALALPLAWYVHTIYRDYRVLARNFYGAMRTVDFDTRDRMANRKFTHGATNHGEQWLDPSRRREPTSYFGPGSGIAKAIAEKDRDKPQRIGITGLGAGVMLSYARQGDYYRIYEIDPDVVRFARTEFTFLADCPAKVDLVLGDARLSLERDPPQNFDVLYLDAFSSDSVPVHLLTREAFDLYFRHLKPDGILVLHISNRYLNLQPVAALAAEALGKQALAVEDYGNDDEGYYGTDMVLLTARKDLFDRQLFMGCKPPEKRNGVRLWTDDYSNLFRVLK